MNDSTESLEEDVQTEDVPDETFVVSDIQTVLVGIVSDTWTASDSPKHTNNTTKQ